MASLESATSDSNGSLQPVRGFREITCNAVTHLKKTFVCAEYGVFSSVGPVN